MTPPDQRDAVWRRLGPVSVLAFLGFAAIALPLPALALYLHDALGLSASAVGWMIGAQSIVTVVSRNRAGIIIDALGPRSGVLIGLPMAAFAGGLYVVASFMPSATLAIVLVLAARIALGVAESFFLTGTLTWGIGRIGAEQTAIVIAWQGIAIYLALGFGAPVGLWLYQHVGFAAVGAAAILAPLLGVALAWGLAAVPVDPRDPTPFYRVFALVWQPGLITTLSTMAYGAVGGFLALLYAERGWAGGGLAFSGLAAGFIGVRLVGSGFAARFGGWRVSAVSLAVEALGQALVWTAPSPVVAALGTTLTGMGFSLIFPAMGVEAVRGVEASRRGQVVANFSAFSDIAIGGTGPVLGLAIAMFGYNAPFAGGAAAALAGLAFIMLRRRSDIAMR